MVYVMFKINKPSAHCFLHVLDLSPRAIKNFKIVIFKYYVNLLLLDAVLSWYVWQPISLPRYTNILSYYCRI